MTLFKRQGFSHVDQVTAQRCLPVANAALHSDSLDIDDLDSRVGVQWVGLFVIVKNLDSTCRERHLSCLLKKSG